MNARTITSAVVGLMVVMLTACGTSRSYPDSRPYPGQPRAGYPYPYPDGRYPDGRYPDGRYPDGRSYPTSRYPDSRYSKRLPPGQAKKIYGGRSARVYAPGHNKDWDGDRNYKSKKSKKYKH